MNSVADTAAALRAHYRAARRALSQQQQHAAALSFVQQLSASAAFHHAESIAFYVAADGELDLQPLIATALDAGETLLSACRQPRGLLSEFFGLPRRKKRANPESLGPV
jgi:5-formyltetrahydrofolate cyclo-ligase